MPPTVRQLFAGATTRSRRPRKRRAPTPDTTLSRRRPRYQARVSRQATRTRKAAASRARSQRLAAARRFVRSPAYTPPKGVRPKRLIRELARTPSPQRGKGLRKRTVPESRKTPARKEAERIKRTTNLRAPGGTPSTMSVIEGATIGIPGVGLAGLGARAGLRAALSGARAVAGRGAAQSAARAAPRAARRKARPRRAAERATGASAAQRIAARREAAKVTRGTKRGAGRRVRKRARRRAYGQAAAVSPAVPAALLGAAEQAGVANLARAPVETARALGDPQTRKETAEGLKQLPIGIATAPYYAARYPKRTIEGMAQHYGEVYGPLLRGDAEGFREALRQPGTGGALTPLIDAALIGGPAASFAAGRAASAGALGTRAQRLMRAERPDLRIGAGPGGVRAQEGSGRIVKRTIQHRRDVRRRQAHERRHGRIIPEVGTRRMLDAMTPAQLRRAGPASARASVGAGEVVSRGGPGVPFTARVVPIGGPVVRRREAKAAATAKSRQMLRHQNARQQMLRSVVLPAAGLGAKLRRRVSRLSGAQQSLVVPVFRGLQILDRRGNVSPRVALQAAERRIAEIREARARGGEAARREVPGRADNIVDFEDIARMARADVARIDRGQAPRVFTPELRGAIESLQRAEVRGAAQLERLADLGTGAGELSQAQMARLKPVVEEMVRRGEGGLPPVENVLATLRLSRRLPENVSRLVDRVQRARRGTPAYEQALDRLFASPGFGTYLNAVGGRRLYRAVERTGRLRPAHVASQPRVRPRAALAATGGSRAPAAFRRTTGSLRRAGREDMRLEAFWQTLERQVKRANTIPLVREIADQFGIPMNEQLMARVASQVEQAVSKMNPQQRATYAGMGPIEAIQALRANGRISVPESLGKRLDQRSRDARRNVKDARLQEARTVGELLDDVDWLGLDRREVALLNVRGLNRELGLAGDSLTDLARITASDPLDPAFAGAFRNNSLRASELTDAARAGLLAEKGYVVIPQRVMGELFSPPGPLERAFRIFDLSKSQFSRLLLGYGNLSWAQFQLAANAFLTGVTGTGPVTAVQGQLWWRRLSDADRKALMPILNQHRHLMDVRKPHLGVLGGPVADQTRAIRNAGWYQSLRRVTPAGIADLMFALDRTQTAFFRRAVLYNRARRQAFKSMNENLGRAAALQDRLAARLWDPRRADDAINAVIRDRRSIERHATYVDQMLGDYLTFTARERATLGRFVMFGAFVRHSVQYALWTMPTKHPVTLGILSKLSLFYDKEQRELLGLDHIPFSLAGLRLSLDDPNGLVLSAHRFSPFGNALFEAQHPSQLVGILPPALSIPISRLTGTNLFTGRPFTTGGESAGSAAFRRAAEGGQASTWETLFNVRMYINELEQMAPPIRYARKVVHRGPHGDDSSLTLGPRPIESESAERSRREAEQAHPLDVIAQQLTGTRRITQGQLGFARERQRPESTSSTPSPAGTGGGWWRSPGSGGGGSGWWRSPSSGGSGGWWRR